MGLAIYVALAFVVAVCRKLCDKSVNDKPSPYLMNE